MVSLRVVVRNHVWISYGNRVKFMSEGTFN